MRINKSKKNEVRGKVRYLKVQGVVEKRWDRNCTDDRRLLTYPNNVKTNVEAS